MRIFKRIEVWLLLIMIGGAVWFVMQPPSDEIGDVDGGTTTQTDPTNNGTATSGTQGVRNPTETGSSRFEISDTKIAFQEGGGMVLEIEVVNRGGEKVELTEENTALADVDGGRFDRFFLPFDEPPILDGTDSSAVLKYWFADVVGVNGEGKENFTLEIEGEELPVHLVLRK